MVNKNSYVAFYLGVILFIVCFGVIIYCLIEFAIDHAGYTFDKEISINDVVLIIVTILLAIVFPITIGRAIENKKISRELLIKLCDRIQGDLLSLRNLILESCGNSVACDINTSIDSIFEYMSYIGTNVDKLTRNAKIEFDAFNDTSIKTGLDTLRDTITDDLRVTGFTFSVSYKSSTSKQIKEFDNLIEDTKFVINNM